MTEKELEKELIRKLEQERYRRQITIKFAIVGMWLIVLSAILAFIFV